MKVRFFYIFDYINEYLKGTTSIPTNGDARRGREGRWGPGTNRVCFFIVIPSRYYWANYIYM